MHRLMVGLALSLFTLTATGDVWTSLYKEKLAEANKGSPEAQFDVGTMYLNGRGVAADRAKALEWLRQAALQGEPKAVTRLKLMQANETRFAKTASLASKGDKESLYDLGNMHLEGVGTNIDVVKAIAAFEQSANQGHTKAAYKIGLIFYEGNGIKPNSKHAFKWFRQAADGGYPAAQYYLGKLYAAGKGVKQDRAEALVWLGKAVDGGFDQARGEMIDVSESMKVKPEPKAETPPKKKTVEKKQAKQQKKAKAKRFTMEDVVLAAWVRDGNPVAWMPSEITTCRSEDDKINCFSDDQVRNAGDNIIKYKTQAVISNFTSNGSFKVSYRNLVISASQDVTVLAGESDDEPGSIDTQQSDTYRIKTGWSNPHKLTCKIKDAGMVTCKKNKAHAIVLTSPSSIVAEN